MVCGDCHGKIRVRPVVGKHCIVNTGASVGHDAQLDDFVHVAPHATITGGVTIGEGTWIGAGTVVKQGIHIGRWCMIGAGSVVVDDIPDGVMAFGNKCKPMKLVNQDMIKMNEMGGVILSLSKSLTLKFCA